MAVALERHDALVRGVVEAAGGTIFKHTGDGMCAVFGDVAAAIRSAVGAQRVLSDETWPLAEPLRARVGLHCGSALCVDGDHFGPTLNRAARIMAAGHGGQTLCSALTVAALGSRPPTGIELVDFGEHNLRDLSGVERIYQVSGTEGPRTFGALRVLDAYRHNLPNQTTNIVGRESDIRTVVGLLRSNRLVTLSGIGGCGKTRLALQAAAELLPEHPAGTWLVDLTVSGHRSSHVLSQRPSVMASGSPDSAKATRRASSCN